MRAGKKGAEIQEEAGGETLRAQKGVAEVQEASRVWVMNAARPRLGLVTASEEVEDRVDGDGWLVGERGGEEEFLAEGGGVRAGDVELGETGEGVAGVGGQGEEECRAGVVGGTGWLLEEVDGFESGMGGEDVDDGSGGVEEGVNG